MVESWDELLTLEKAQKAQDIGVTDKGADTDRRKDTEDPEEHEGQNLAYPLLKQLMWDLFNMTEDAESKIWMVCVKFED